jgi:hypothetical protein
MEGYFSFSKWKVNKMGNDKFSSNKGMPSDAKPDSKPKGAPAVNKPVESPKPAEQAPKTKS